MGWLGFRLAVVVFVAACSGESAVIYDQGGEVNDLASPHDAACEADACSPSVIVKPLPAPQCGTPDDQGGGVDWLGNMTPSPIFSPAYMTAPATLAVSAAIYAASRTNPAGAASGIVAELWTNLGGSCAQYPMGYIGDDGNNDRYQGTLPLANTEQGVYRYRVRAGDGADWFYGPEALLLIDPLPALGRILTAWPPGPSAEANRDHTLLDLDACLLSNYFTTAGGFLDVRAPEGSVRDYFIERIDEVVTRLESPATEAEVLLLYNAGIVYRTPSVTLGIDLVIPSNDGLYAMGWEPSPALEARLAAQVKLLLVTHGHSDHCDPSLISAVLAVGGTVLAPSTVASQFPGARGIVGDEDMTLDQVQVHAFTGPHAYEDPPQTDHRHYEITAPDGPILLHTGDLDYTLGLRHSSSSIGILVAKAGGVSPRYDEQNSSDLGDDVDAFMLAVDAVHPRLALPIPLMEVGHTIGGGRESYQMALGFRARVEGAGSQYAILAAGDQLGLSFLAP